MRLKGKKVLVTGSSRGIGRGLALELSKEGAQVGVTYGRSREAAESLMGELAGDGHQLLQMDVSNEESIDEGFKSLLDSWGGLDGLVNNAGITRDQLLLRMKTEDFDEVIATNLKGSFLCSKKALKPMVKAKGGSIVNISSVVGQSGNPGQSNYCASKAGLEGFTRSLAIEMGSRNIRANCVAPGFIITEMTDELGESRVNDLISRVPLARMGTVDDIASAVVYLLSDESTYVTGQVLQVNGGMYM